jgi:hypothetical protein
VRIFFKKSKRYVPQYVGSPSGDRSLLNWKEKSEMNKLKKGMALLFLLTMVFTSFLWSGTTGKITGTVTDKSNGDPIIGANIIIAGTSLGAATDVNGHYTILYIPPGKYDLKVSYIGYRKVVVKDIRVFIDQTARVDITLEQEAIRIGETVVVAERKLIKPDMATSGTSISAEEFATIPTTSVMSALGLQAGVRGGWGSSPTSISGNTSMTAGNSGKVSVQDGMSIRGGSGDNMLFLVNGVTIRDPRNNEPATKLPMSSVEEVSVERGGFNAEYGQVQSGVVNVITREGSKDGYSGSLQFRYAPPAAKYAKVAGTLDVNDPYSFVLRPFFDPDVCWTGTTNGNWNKYMQAMYPTFSGWNAISKTLCTDNNPTNDLTPLGAQRAFEYEIRKAQSNNQPDFDIDGGFGGPVPLISKALGDLRFFAAYRGTREMLLFPLSRSDYRDYDISYQVTSDISSSTKLSVTGLNGKKYTLQSNWDGGTGSYYYPHYPNEIADVASSITGASDLYSLYSDYVFCLADIGHQSIAAKLTHTVSSSTFYEVSVEHYRTDYSVRPQSTRDTSVQTEVLDGFYENSNPYGYWTSVVQAALLDNGITNYAFPRDNSVFNSTTVKASLTSQVNFQNLIKGGLEFCYNDLNFDYGKIYAGGQGTETYANRVKMRVYPLRAAAYLQDKLEFKEFTVNGGLRLDYNNSNVEWWNMGVFDPAFFTTDTSTSAPKTNTKPKWNISPRLGISHPISEHAKLFFNYGHFLEMPQYESMFRVQRDQSGDMKRMTSFGNPNLVQAKTISYELGVDYSVGQDYLLNVAGFYNDISDMQTFVTYVSASDGISYTKSASNGYQDTRGFEVTLRKTSPGWLMGFVNYTYQVTSTGHFGSAYVYDDITSQKQYDDATVYQYQDRPMPQPFARANLTFASPAGFGPSLFGYHVFERFTLNTVLDWQAGGWTTYSPNNAYVAYNVKAVDYFNTYLRLDKTIDLGKVKLQFFMDVNNVLNTLRLWNTSNTTYLASLHLPKSDCYGNIIGDDKVGVYREPGVDYQPVEHVSVLGSATSSTYETAAWYYQDKDQKYYQWATVNGVKTWVEVGADRVRKCLDDKAYISMPNASTYWFLNPRNFYFGLKLSFNFE